MKNLIILTLTTLLLSACSTGNVLVLKFKIPDKSSFNYEYKMEQDITTTTMGMDQKQSQKETIEYEYKLLKTLPDNAKDIRVKIVRVVAEQESPMGSVNYDSGSGDATVDQMSRIYEQMVGQEFRMKMKPDGEVTEVTGADKMLDDMISVTGLSDEDEAIKTFKTSLKRQFGDAAMAENMSMLTMFYPDKPVKPGDSWEKTITRKASIGLIITTTYKLISRGKGKAYIDFSSKIKPLPDAAPMELGVMSIQYELSGQQTGSMVVNETTGWTEESEVHQLISGDMKISSPELPFGTIDGTMEAKSVIKVLKLD